MAQTRYQRQAQIASSRRKRLTALGKTTCAGCGKEFQRTREWHVTCSPRCRYVLFQKRKQELLKNQSYSHE